ncbi:hypothetical protein CPB97_007442 [Podila verticillata]|nr:hypothetical protein CPB97_007442 [Podila verticillata]
MPSTSIKWASPKKRFGKSSTSMMSQALEAESNQYRQQQLGHLSNSRMLSVGLGGNSKAQYGFYRRRGKLGFDKLPREIRVHVFRYLTTFQLIRVSRVSRIWRNIAMDGSLWKVIDTTRYYKAIQDDQLLNLGVSASGFLRYVNFRGCAQLSSDSLSTIAEHCPNVERLDLTGCRQLSSKALADVCMNMTSLIHLDLASLVAVNNYTLQAMAVYCRSLRVLNLAWCRHITGAGLSKLTKSCQELQKLNVSGCSGMEDRWMPTIGMNLPRLKELCMNGCQSLTDRGLIGLLSGLSVGSTKKYRKRRNMRRLSSSIRVAALGEDPLVSHSSSCLDDNDYDEDDEDSLDDMDKDAESDNDASDDEDTEQGASEGAQDGSGLPLPSQSPHPHQEGLQTRLRYLGLSNCRQLTQEALRAVGHHCSRHLRRLEISGCGNFGDEGLIYLAQHCTSLRLLDLEDDSLLTDASLRAFGMHLPHLERICLSYCENITDQGVLRMLKPLAVNPNTPVNMAVNPDKFCSKLAHLELDNCLLVTDRLLLEFANVLEDRRIKAIEKQREKERKREERRERIRQKKKKPLCSSEHQDEDEDTVETKKRDKHGYSEGSLRSLVEIVNKSMPSTSYHTAYPPPVEEKARPVFISSAPVNIPTAPYKYHPSLAAAAAASSSSISSSPSPLQPRGVMASTSVSEEMAIKKAGQKPILRIITPTRSSSTSSTTSLTSSSSLPLWPSALQSRRAMPPRPQVKRPQPPTLQVFDCRNISLEGVEASQKKCESLVIKSYYSWTNPRTSTAVSTARARRSYSLTSSSFGAAVASSGYFGSSYGGIEFGEEEEDDEENGTEDEEEMASASNSHSSLHQLQLQHQQNQQYPQRARSLFHRARLGLMGGRGHGPQCHIL